MKKITLLATVIFLMGNTVQSQSSYLITENNLHLNNDHPISFNERGINFFVFPNGEFDFDTATNAENDIVYRKGRRYLDADAGVIIEHDSQGRVRRVGNVFMNYDYQNRIKRIGSVYMKYNRFVLTHVGGMQLMYDRNKKLINTIGLVKRYDTRYGYCYNFNENQHSDNATYYYRKNGLRK